MSTAARDDGCNTDGRPVETPIVFVECGGCRIPVRVTDTVPQVVFPDDIRAIEDIVAGRFNAVRHFCGHRVTFPTTVTLTGPSGRTMRFDDHDRLRTGVGALLVLEGRDLFAALKDYDELDRAGKLAALTPVRLLALALELDGRRRAGSPDHDTFEKLYLMLVTEHLRLFAGDAAVADELHRLPDLMRAAVPAPCLTPALLTALCEQCDDEALVGTPFDRDRLGAGFRAEFTCAVAHLLAGEENPRQEHWATLVAGLWTMSRLEHVRIDDRYFLDAAALRATIPFPLLWKVTFDLRFPDGLVTLAGLGELRESYVGLHTRAGYELLFYEQLVTLTAHLVERNAAVHDRAELFELVRAMTRSGMDLGTAAAVFAAYWTEAFPPRTEELVRYFGARVRETGTPTDECRFAAGATRWLNARGEWSVAIHLMTELVNRLGDDLPGLSPRERLDLWNEIGNSFRFTGDGSLALDAYRHAADACAELGNPVEPTRILTLNRAIVLRDHNRLREAEALFTALVAAHPHDPGVLHSLTVFHDRAGTGEQIPDIVATALALPALSATDAAKFLLARADEWRRQGRHDDAVADLRRCWRLFPATAIDHRLRVAAVGALSRPAVPELVEFRTSLVAFVFEQAPARVDVALGGGIAALASVAEEALTRGDTATARRALELALPAPRAQETCRVAQLAVYWAWLLDAEGDPAAALPWLVEGLRSLDDGVPSGQDAGFAVGWVGRAGHVIDRVLELATRLFDDPADLVAAYEIANGRELSAHAADAGTDLARAARDTRCDIVLLLDGTEHLTAVVVPASGAPPVTERIPLPAEEIDRAVRQLAAFDLANPVAPHRVDRKLAGWWHVAGVLAGTLRPHLTDGAELVVLPGRRLAATPLHLAGWPDAPLVDERPVSVCPNVRVLLGGRARRGGPVGVVAVPKATDTAGFRAELLAAAAEVAGGAPVLAGADADEQAVLALARDAGEIVFLCHGVTTSGPGQGPGICLAADGHLPPSPLPVDSDPDLGRFVLSWRDLLDLPHTPPMVVSVACSTGRSRTGPGGTRIGLEQGFLARGSDTIVSPLWNIGQEPALAWLRSFYANHSPGSDDVGAAHRAACLEVRRHHPHPFAWGPFLLTRRLPEAST